MLERLHELSVVEHEATFGDDDDDDNDDIDDISVVKYEPTFLGHEQLEAVHPQLLGQLLHVAP